MLLSSTNLKRLEESIKGLRDSMELDDFSLDPFMVSNTLYESDPILFRFLEVLS